MKFSYPSGAKPLPGYTLKRGIGIGGFGEVYFALNDAGKEVALKKIQRNLDIELRGVRQCLNIRHVNLIALWDIQTSSSQESWVVMEYVPGPSLRDLLDDHPRGLPENALKLWFTSIVSGVAYLHHRGIVHRDLKPANVFRDDDAHVIKIGDYGLSKFVSCDRQSGQTGAVGTVHYMAPEISRGSYGKEIDIYALGIILYELLTGDVPFDGETSQEIMYKHLLETADLSQCPAAYHEVIKGCLCKEPRDRFSNVSELIAAMPWSEFRGKDAKVLSLHSVGVFPQPEHTNPSTSANYTSPANQEGSSSAMGGARIEPILLSNEADAAQIPAIVFGPPSREESAADQQRKQRLRKTTPPRDSQLDDVDLRASEQSKKRKFTKRTTVVGLETEDLARLSNAARGRSERPKGKLLRLSQRRRIAAKRVARKLQQVSDRVSEHALATPIRLVTLIAGAWALVASPHWLPWVLVSLGVVWASWSLVRLWAGGSDFASEVRLARRTGVSSKALRKWYESRLPADRLVQWLGGILLGVFSCGALSLFGFTLWKSIFALDVTGWAFFAWLAISCSVSCILVLSCGSWWVAQVEIDFLQRRLVMFGIGLVAGVVSILAANLFEVDLTFSNFAQPSSGLFDWSLPVMPAWLLFFIGLFGLYAWWKIADPVRETRLRVWDVCVCVVVAGALSQLLNLPLAQACIISGVVSVSVQLASTWINYQQRELVGLDAKDAS